MDKLAATFVTAIILIFMLLIANVFMVSLPYWCANPNIGSNHYVHPICKE